MQSFATALEQRLQVAPNQAQTTTECVKQTVFHRSPVRGGSDTLSGSDTGSIITIRHPPSARCDIVSRALTCGATLLPVFSPLIRPHTLSLLMQPSYEARRKTQTSRLASVPACLQTTVFGRAQLASMHRMLHSSNESLRKL